MESNHRYTVLQTAALTTWLPWEGLTLASMRASPRGSQSGIALAEVGMLLTMVAITVLILMTVVNHH